MQRLMINGVEVQRYDDPLAVVIYREDIKEINGRCKTIYRQVKAGRFTEAFRNLKAIIRLLEMCTPAVEYESLTVNERREWLFRQHPVRDPVTGYRVDCEVKDGDTKN